MKVLGRRRYLPWIAGVMAGEILGSGTSLGGSLEQRVGVYSDTQGLQRQRIGYDLAYDWKGLGGGLVPWTGQSLNLNLVRDQINLQHMVDDAYTRQVYGTPYRLNHGGRLTWGQMWGSARDTRQGVFYSSDGVVTAQTFTLGASQWFWRDTIRIGADVSRTTVEQPLYQILDYDSEAVGNPPLITSTGATLALRHLASPSTIVDYSAGLLLADNRPPARSVGASIRQYIRWTSSALHFSMSRAWNRGVITKDTTFGEVDAWTAEGALLQEWGKKTRVRFAYRAYREDETTRVYRDERTLGTDRLILGLEESVSAGALAGVSWPLALNVAVARYLTNADLAAQSLEMGITATL